jgi:hypothetical protein
MFVHRDPVLPKAAESSDDSDDDDTETDTMADTGTLFKRMEEVRSIIHETAAENLTKYAVSTYIFFNCSSCSG